MNRYRIRNLLRLLNVVGLCTGILVSEACEALNVGAIAQEVCDRTVDGASSICNAPHNELPMAAIRPSIEAEFVAGRTSKLPQDKSAVTDGLIVALPIVLLVRSKSDTELPAPSSGSLVSRHDRLQI